MQNQKGSLPYQLLVGTVFYHPSSAHVLSVSHNNAHTYRGPLKAAVFPLASLCKLQGPRLGKHRKKERKKDRKNQRQEGRKEGRKEGRRKEASKQTNKHTTEKEKQRATACMCAVGTSRFSRRNERSGLVNGRKRLESANLMGALASRLGVSQNLGIRLACIQAKTTRKSTMLDDHYFETNCPRKDESVCWCTQPQWSFVLPCRFL